MLALDEPPHIAPDIHAGQQYGHLRMFAVVARGRRHGFDEAWRVVSGSSARKAPAEVCRMDLRMVSSTEGS